MNDVSVELRDQLSIDTPELVSLEFPVAGTGSRAIACVIDYLIQGVAFTVIVLLIALLASMAPHTASTAQPATSTNNSPSETWAMAIFALVLFLFQWGYFTLFEAFWGGRTPGKRLLNLRVLQQSGRSIGFLDAFTRNLLRIVDGLPGFYLVGIVCLFATRRSQRLGDLVAGTIVVHERKIESSLWEGTGARQITAPLAQLAPATEAARSTGLPADRIARLSPAELEVIESFCARRLDLPYETSTSLAAKLAGQMAARMDVALPGDMGPETFLDALAADLRSLGDSARRATPNDSSSSH